MQPLTRLLSTDLEFINGDESDVGILPFIGNTPPLIVA
jgi:hypothetical protein